MKTIQQYIKEKQINERLFAKTGETLTPKNKEELIEMIYTEIKRFGINCDLNHIDVSNITDFSDLFAKRIDNQKANNIHDLHLFNGDISAWDVSNATNIDRLFYGSKFNGDLSRWDVSNVTTMKHTFSDSKFTGENGDISNWNVSNVKNMSFLFLRSNYAGDISEWDVSNVEWLHCTFDGCKKFNSDLSEWDVSKVISVNETFARTNYNKNLDKWNLQSCRNYTKCFYKSPLENNPPKWYKV